VLLFDEADAMFARRIDNKDAIDRHANADTGHLLQLLEGHEGVAILATNRRSAIDPAFIRRLRHGIDFPRPNAAERQIWRVRSPRSTAILLAIGKRWPASPSGTT
jgi:SpoVK/Ycf46/Vps4 family AAA+-type ATPase